MHFGCRLVIVFCVMVELLAHIKVTEWENENEEEKNLTFAVLSEVISKFAIKNGKLSEFVYFYCR